MFRPARIDRLSAAKQTEQHSIRLFLLRPTAEENIRKALTSYIYSRCEVIWDQVWDQLETEVAGPVADQLRRSKVDVRTIEDELRQRVGGFGNATLELTA